MSILNAPVDYREQLNVTAPALPYYPEETNPNDIYGPGGGYYPAVEPDRGPRNPIDDPYWDTTGGGGIPEWLKNIGGGIKDFIDPNGRGNWMERAALAGTALNQYNNAGKYMDLAGKYSHEMNPFDLAQRQYYQGKLRSSYEDPTAFLNDPGHLAMQTQQLNKLQGRLRAQGYMGSGKEGMDLSDYVTQSDAQYLQKEREQLGGLAGSSIGPGAAADLIKTGIQGSIKSQNDALAAMTQALSPRDSGQGGGLRDRTLTGEGGSVLDWVKKGAGWAKSLAQGGAIPWRELARLGKLDLYDPEYQAFIRAQGDAENAVHQGNLTGQYDEHGGLNPGYVSPPEWYPGGEGGGYGGEGTGIGDESNYDMSWLTGGNY